jgi:hypothetical protein
MSCGCILKLATWHPGLGLLHLVQSLSESLSCFFSILVLVIYFLVLGLFYPKISRSVLLSQTCFQLAFAGHSVSSSRSALSQTCLNNVFAGHSVSSSRSALSQTCLNNVFAGHSVSSSIYFITNLVFSMFVLTLQFLVLGLLCHKAVL